MRRPDAASTDAKTVIHSTFIGSPTGRSGKTSLIAASEEFQMAERTIQLPIKLKSEQAERALAAASQRPRQAWRPR
jgi:hypothetical protein